MYKTTGRIIKKKKELIYSLVCGETSIMCMQYKNKNDCFVGVDDYTTTDIYHPAVRRGGCRRRCLRSLPHTQTHTMRTHALRPERPRVHNETGSRCYTRAGGQIWFTFNKRVCVVRVVYPHGTTAGRHWFLEGKKYIRNLPHRPGARRRLPPVPDTRELG